MSSNRLCIGVLDFETDPFQYGRIPNPFAAEFYSDSECYVTWGVDCVDRIIEHISRLEHRYLIYTHNGGKFDFHFIHRYIDNPVHIINSRIVSAKLFEHTIRDSFAIMPVALKHFKGRHKKLEIDYRHMEEDVRETYKDEILEYLHADCLTLHENVSAFVERFGPMLTVGSTAMKQLQSLHAFSRMSIQDDEVYRKFYFGGRVQCFKSGILHGPYTGYDVNSSYPNTMKNLLHPDKGFSEYNDLPNDFDLPYFAIIDATNRNALPFIDRSTSVPSLNFNVSRETFHVCSHELEVAIKWGLIDIHQVHRCYVANDVIEFAFFVDKFYNEKVQAKKNGDVLGEMFAKFMLTSCYGKFGQNPANYSDWLINRDFGMDMELLKEGYSKEAQYDEFELWAKPSDITPSGFYNVAIAASITSGARATLLDGLQLSDDPVYCDTDSVICRNFRGDIDPHTLGSWKLEFTCDNMAIGGKKLYAAYNDDGRTRTKVKIASKGGTLNVDNVIAIASGSSVNVRQDAPVFSLHSSPKFLARNFRMTTMNDIGVDNDSDDDHYDVVDYPNEANK